MIRGWSEGSPRKAALLILSTVLLTLAAGPLVPQVRAQVPGTSAAMPEAPEVLEILGLSVEGVASEGLQSFVIQRSGLEVGQTVRIPGDAAFADAIRNVYRYGMFSDVKIVEERRVGDGVYLAIQVREEPRLAEFEFEGPKKSERRDLRDEVPLLLNQPVRPSEVERSIQVIEQFYDDKGHPLAEVDVDRTVREDNTVSLRFDVDKGPRVRVEEIRFVGNEQVSDRTLRKQLDETKRTRWYRPFRKARFDERMYQEDLAGVLAYYNKRGFYDAEIVRDSVFIEGEEGGDPYYVVEVEVREGNPYHIRSIAWDGNTVFTEEQLNNALGFLEGDRFDGEKLESNLYANEAGTDIGSLYYNRGYMQFQVRPSIRVAPGDSLDLAFEVFEGDVFTFGDINIAGNSQTKDHVVRRELYTLPGETFSRELIQESIRRVSQLNYFSQESLFAGPAIEMNEADRTVDLTYNLEEAGSSQLQLSGTYGRFGIVLQLGFAFNNFSASDLLRGEAWRPIPTGDGQQLSLNVQTNGRYFQQYSASFTEPWFRGKPTPLGGAISYTRINRNPFSSVNSSQGLLDNFSVRGFYQQRLKWPDDKFQTGTTVRYQLYNNENWSSVLPQNVSQEVTIQQSLTRNSTDHPFFPTSGSKLNLSAELAVPFAGFTQYYKTRFTTSWNFPLTRNGKINIGVGADYGYIGSVTGDEVTFERFIMGGSPFDTQGSFNLFGREVIFMRGYPANVLGPRLQRSDGRSEPVGGQIMNKYQAELRWNAVSSQQLSASPYLFMEAGNVWAGGSTYNPTQLYRSAGVGARLFLPILGMIEVAYGRNLDTFVPVVSGETGEPNWDFQFTIGQGFNF
jgi:outer membrane protein insertion porin family